MKVATVRKERETDRRASEGTTASGAKVTRETMYLTLGDGDFSFSLDLATLILEQQNKCAEKNNASNITLIATGIDSEENLSSKYKDSSHTLDKIRRISNEPLLSVKVKHRVNAISPCSDSLFYEKKVDILIFNHPHLGTEDARLHSQFLCHLFHVASMKWLAVSGLFHLTLAKGQYTRWKCEEAANRQGMRKVDSIEFKGPAVSDPHYQFRRHQSGKSFATRVSGASETFTYMRAEDPKPCRPFRPLWIIPIASLAKRGNKEQFSCPFCPRTFCEKRSITNHIKSKHADARDKKRKHESECVVLKCTLCEHIDRVFESSEALEDHIKAKHRAIHSTIQPDWQHVETPNMPVSQDIEGFCDICGCIFHGKFSNLEHILSFDPDEVSVGVGDSGRLERQCVFCSKKFRENRARLQHENFCSARTHHAKH